MPQRNILRIPNPDRTDTLVFTNTLLERAPDSGGVPGTFAQIASLTIDTAREFTKYVDALGEATSWYRWRYTDGTTNGDYSTNIQFGDYKVRQWIKSDILDTDITNSNWDQWRDETIIDMANEGLGRPVETPQDFAPATFKNMEVDVRSDIRRVVRVELFKNDNFYTVIRNWHQFGRKLRIFFPRTTFTYRVWGIGELRGLIDLDDNLFEILKWGMKMRYTDFRKNQRLDLRAFLARTRQTDTSSVRDFQALYLEAKREFQDRVDKYRDNFAVSGGGL